MGHLGSKLIRRALFQNSVPYQLVHQGRSQCCSQSVARKDENDPLVCLGNSQPYLLYLTG